MPEDSGNQPSGDDEGKIKKPAFTPKMAIKPISMMVILIVVTLSLALWLGPYYDALGMRSEFSGYTDNPLYAFAFLIFVIVFAVAILILRKILKRRKLKLKYLFAIAVFFSTMYVVMPLIDIAANGPPNVWDVRYFDVDDPRGVLPIDPYDPEQGILVVTDSSFHFMVPDEDNENGYDEVLKMDELQSTFDPHFNEDLWIVCGRNTEGYQYWTVDTAGKKVHEGTIVSEDPGMNLTGVNLWMVEDDHFLVSFWNTDSGEWNVTISLPETGEVMDSGFIRDYEGPLNPVFGYTEDRNHFFNETYINRIILAREDDRITVTTEIISKISNATWVRVDDTSILYWSPDEFSFADRGTLSDNVFISSSTGTEGSQTDTKYTFHTGEIESPYHVAFDIDHSGIEGQGYVYRFISLRGDTVIIRSVEGEESHTYTGEPISVFQDGHEGDIYLAFDGLVQHGYYEDEQRMQLWIQGASLLISGLIITAIMIKPKWWLIDLSGILMGAGVVALMGVSFPILFTLTLMVLLAIYDAVAVYKTKHMIALADSVVESKMPILLVFPMKWSYRYEDETNLMDPKRKRESLFMGLGDVIIPGILVVSSFLWLPKIGGSGLAGLPASLTVSLFTLAGMLLGFGILMRWVIKGKAHAGLPPLNGGAILGFLLGHLIVYGTLVFW